MSRIIAGQARGQRLSVPTGDITRPTTDRVREAFFGSLVAWNGGADAGPVSQLSGLAFLDLFAGSGAVGLEAASRGASPVLLVESDSKALAAIKQNLASTKLTASVRQSKVEPFVDSTPTQRYDLIFLDPPYKYATTALQRVLERLVEAWLVPDGAIVVERDARSVPIQLAGVEQWDRKHGETVLTWICPLRTDDASTESADLTHQPEGVS